MLGIIGLFDIGAPEIILIAIVFLVLFGSKKIPELMQGLGKGIREFKDATNGIQKEIQENTGHITNQIQEHIQEVKKEIEK